MLTPTEAARAVGLAALAVVLAGCASPVRRPMEMMGPWAVGFRRATAVDERRGGRELPLAVWYPVAPAEALGRRARYTCLRHPLLTLSIRSDVAVRDAPPARGHAWPLVVFSHAAPSLETQSPNYVETLASHGFVVIAPRHVGGSTFETQRAAKVEALATRTVTSRDVGGRLVTRRETVSVPQVIAAAQRGEAWALELAGSADHVNFARTFDVWSVIDWAAAQARDPSSFLYRAADAERVGVTGHSAGGCTALAAAAGYGGRPPDPRILAIVPVAAAGTTLIPDETLRTVTAPALFIAGDRDEVAPWTAEAMRACRLLGSRPADIVKIHNAGHCHFADVDGFAHLAKAMGLYPWAWQWPSGRRLRRTYREAHADGTLTPYEAQRILNKYAVAFLLRHLKGDTARDAAFATSPARHDEPLVEIITCHDDAVPGG